MSSPTVRTSFKAHLTAGAPSEVQVDLTAAFDEIKDLLSDYDLQPDAPWLGLQFEGGEVEPIGLYADNQKGLYREFGAVHFHVVAAARLGVGDSIVSRAQSLQKLFLGQRIGDIVIDRVTAVNTDAGSTLQFEGGYVSGSFFVGYHRDIGTPTDY